LSMHRTAHTQKEFIHGILEYILGFSNLCTGFFWLCAGLFWVYIELCTLKKSAEFVFWALLIVRRAFLSIHTTIHTQKRVQYPFQRSSISALQRVASYAQWFLTLSSITLPCNEPLRVQYPLQVCVLGGCLNDAKCLTLSITLHWNEP